MNKTIFKNLNLIFWCLLCITSLYIFISPNQTPLVQIFKIYEKFTLKNIINGSLIVFIQTFLVMIFYMNFKVTLRNTIIALIFNLVIIKLFGIDWNLESIKYCLNFAILMGVVGFFIEYKKEKSIEIKKYYNYGLFLGIIPIIYAYFIFGSLNILTYIIPNTNDIQAFIIDSYYKIPKSIDKYYYFFNDYISYKSITYNIIFYTYNFINLAVLMLAIIEYKYGMKNKRYYINSILNISILLFIGIFLYTLYPIMGPKYLKESLVNAIGNDYIKINISDYIGVLVSGSQFPRNGMPSMHFSLSLFAFINTIGMPIYIRLIYCIFFIITALATIILGEHYFIDWLLALPVIIISLLISDKIIPLKDKLKLYSLNIINILFVYLFLWYGIDIVHNIFNCFQCELFSKTFSTILYIITILTICLFIYSYKKIYKMGNNILANINQIENTNIFTEITNVFKFKIQNIKNLKLSILFILSGFAGLMYQVIFGKMLSTTFGSNSLAIYIILATYMIGISLGSYFISISNKNNEIPPLFKYSICEGAIALYCAITPILFIIIDSLYVDLISYNNSIYYIVFIKVVLGILGLIIPTVLMGMTTPILLKEFSKDENNSVSIAKLYSLNTLGAAFGALISGYIIIPSIGIKNSIYLAVLLNLIIAGVSLDIVKKVYKDSEINNFFKKMITNLKNEHVSYNYSIDKNIIYYKSMILLLMSGIITMVMETMYVHSLSIVVGNSTYVFSIMLFTFLIGLSLGGYVGKEIIKKYEINFEQISISQIILSFVIFMSYNLLDKIPNYFSSFSNSNNITEFGQKEFLRFIVCFGVMILPTIFTGIIYTLSMKKLNDSNNIKELENKVISKGLAVNTLGNILGIFIGGFIFINILHINNGFKYLSLIVLIISLLLSYKNKKIFSIGLIFTIILIVHNYKLNMDLITSGSNVYFNQSSRGTVIEYKENIDGGLTSVNKMKIKNENVITLLTNGKFQGNDNAESIAQGGFAIAPILHLNENNLNNALIIGYGTGMTTRAIHDAGFKNLDVVDLSKDIIDLADKYFSNINHSVRQNKNVKTIISDGRNYLKLNNKKYDLISMEITSIWFSGASYLYNKDFYEIAKNKLNKDGVLQQWVQLHHMNPNDFNIIVNTIRSQFKYVSVYYIGGQGIIVATNSIISKDINVNTIKYLNENKNLKEIKVYYKDNFESIKNNNILNSEKTDKYLLKTYGKNVNYFISTDDNLILEYNTPKGNSIKENTENIIINLINKKLSE